MKKICKRCSASFSCREDRIELCSCRKVSLVIGVRDYIKDNYRDCLCPKCLQEANTSFYAFDVNPKFLNKNKNE
ncbi:cysteine-rich CWC family protein [Dysgonomonas termitidis]|uniref:Cysteine-rich CWC family protein n=1 Tax=Dysgonomonas termitidis TaxID=1516126 RepID=A0ABV9L2R7_9BACT